MEVMKLQISKAVVMWLMLACAQGAFVGGNALSTGAFGRRSATAEERPKSEVHTIAGGPASWNNPTGRVSVQFSPGAVSHHFHHCRCAQAAYDLHATALERAATFHGSEFNFGR